MDDVLLIERLTKLEERAKSNTHQIDELKCMSSELRLMSNTLVLLVEQMKNTNKGIGNLEEKVERLESEPGSKWKTAGSTMLTTVVSTISQLVVVAVLYAAVTYGMFK